MWHIACGGAALYMQDFRFALRQLLKNPGFTAVAVLTLALGIGVNTSMFSALQAILLRALPYPAPDQLVRIHRTSSQSQSWPHSAANFLDERGQNQVFSGMAALSWASFNLAESGQPAERLHGMIASADLFSLFGVQPALGRVFTGEEDQPGRNNVVVLNYGFWQHRFAGDTNIIGRTLRLDGELVTVLGVMPAQFHDPLIWGPVDVWRPLAFTTEQRQNRGNNWLQSVARLRPGVTLAQAQAEMTTIAARLAKEYPDNNTDIGLRLQPLAESGTDATGHRVIWMTMGLTGFVLLIACANLANLQFARTARRSRELAIRGALGAPRGRLLRGLLTESLLIALLGGLLALVVATWVNEWIGRQIILGDETGLRLPLNLKALGFAALASMVTGLAFGLAPAWFATRPDVNDALKQGGRGVAGDRTQNRVRHGLIVAEMALALVLLAGAALFVRGLDRFTFRDPGWAVDGLTTGSLSLPESKYRDDGQRRAFVAQLQEKLGGLPGATGAAIAWSLPIYDGNFSRNFAVEGRPPPPRGHEPLRFVNGVTPGYFAVLGIPLRDGRDFNPADTANRSAVAVINETMARTFWPGESPIGKRIGGVGDWEEVVGVVGDVRFAANFNRPDTYFQTYRPFTQSPRAYLSVAVRGAVPADTLRRAVTELDPDQPVNDPGTARAAVTRNLGNFALTGRLLGGFALLGLLLAGLGIYGVIAGQVVQRTSEIGVRMVLGAQLRDVLWLVLGKGLQITILGAGIGLVGALGVARLLRSITPELPTNDPAVVLGMAALLLVVALIACWLPAARAARVDPMVALRNE